MRLSDEQRAELREVWPKVEVPLREIAQRFSVDPSRLSGAAKRMGLPRRAYLRWPPQERRDRRASRV